MKRYLFITFVYLITNVTYSQKKIVLIDSLTRQPISFAIIQKKNGTGVYSNENGVFNIEQGYTDTLKIYHLGYYIKTIKSTKLSDSLFLKPRVEELKEVIINSRGKTQKDIKLLKKPGSFNNMFLRSGTEILTFLFPNNKILDFEIDKIIFHFNKLKYSKNKDELKEQQSVIKINIYELKKDRLNKLIFSSKPKKINAYNKDELIINLKEEFITLKKEGIAFGIEYIGNIDKNGDFYKTLKLYLRPSLVKNNSKYYNAKTFLKYTLKNKNETIPINKIINSNLPKDLKKSYDRNLAISLELSK